MGRPQLSLEIKFWSKVKKTSGCWLWTGSRTVHGYAKVTHPRHIQHKASRVSWELHNGPIPEGIQVCHSCDNPMCVNPGHLFLGTFLENMRDKIRKGRQARGMAVSNLTDTDIVNIRELAGHGKLHREIGVLFGVGQAHITRIVNRKRWKHVP